MIEYINFKVPKKTVEEKFLYEQLYIEEQFILVEISQEKKANEEIERGVITIDLF